MSTLSRKWFITVVFTIQLIPTINAQDQLRKKISTLAESISGDVGVAIRLVERNDTLSHHGKHPFPMQSIYKFPLALLVLKQVDEGKLKLDQNIYLARQDYFETHSPLMSKYSEADEETTMKEILQFTVSQSDNVGCDLLFRFVGGPKKVDQFVHSLGIEDMAIINTEREMHENDSLQFQNWSTPVEMANLFHAFYTKNILTPRSQELLINYMVNTTVGLKRIKGQLPEGTVVAHRTGTGSTKNRVTSAVNNAGIITLPNGNHLIVVVYITNTREDIEIAEAVIASIAKMAYDYFSK
ncbi:MAG: class A beta-lactamase [Chryseolinea sp.]